VAADELSGCALQVTEGDKLFYDSPARTQVQSGEDTGKEQLNRRTGNSVVITGGAPVRFAKFR
jgi:hypothetical protein